ncbi:MAG: hypothetical protein WCH96_12880 [Betaproteobacteria bacterium]
MPKRILKKEGEDEVLATQSLTQSNETATHASITSHENHADVVAGSTLSSPTDNNLAVNIELHTTPTPTPIAPNPQPITDFMPMENPRSDESTEVKKDPELASPTAAEEEIIEAQFEDNGQAEEALEKHEHSLDSLIKLVLDSASVANRSADMAAGATEQMVSSVGHLGQSITQSKINHISVLTACTILLVTALAVLMYTGYRLSQTIEHADAMVYAVGKRVIEMNIHLDESKKGKEKPAAAAELDINPLIEALQKLDARITALSNDPNNKSALDLQDRQNKAFVSEQKSIISQAAIDQKSVNAQLISEQKSLNAQIKSLETNQSAQAKALQTQIESQAKLMKRLSDQLASTQTNIPKLDALATHLETLMHQQHNLIAESSKSSSSAPVSAKAREKSNSEFIKFSNTPRNNE